MFLQRLTQWFTTAFSRIASHVRDAFTYDDEHDEHEPAMSGHTRMAPHNFMSADYLLPPNWLEDARRLRPQLLAPDVTPQRRPLEKPPLEKSEKQKQQLSGPSRVTGTNGQAAGQAARIGTPQPQQPSRPTPPAQPVQAIPTSPADAATPQDTLDDLLHRRLMSLKHLVRLGVYNEGFTSGRTPEQYHRSLGIDEFDDDLGEE